MCEHALGVTTDLPLPAIVLNESRLALAEDGSIGPYTVRLNKAPSGNMRVQARPNGGALAIRFPG